MECDHFVEHGGLTSEVKEARRRMWWLLVDLDSRLSLWLGRAPCLSLAALQIPQPSFDGLKGDPKALQKSRLEFIRHKMQIIALMYDDKDKPGVDVDAKRSKQDTLMRMLESFQEFHTQAPAPSQDHSKDVLHSIAVAEHQLDMHLFSMVLNHHVARTTAMEQDRPSAREKQISAQGKHSKSRNVRKQSPSKHYKEMHQSARQIMELFNHIHNSDTSKSTLSWTQCFVTYYAAWILGIARLRQDSELNTDSSRIKQTLMVFQELVNNKAELSIAPLVIAPLEKVVAVLCNIESSEDTLPRSVSKQMMQAPPAPERSTIANDVPVINTGMQNKLKRGMTSSYEDDAYMAKRPRYPGTTPMFDEQGEIAAWTTTQEQPYAQIVPPYGDVPMGSFHGQPSFPPSASSSFTGYEPLEYPASLGYTSAQASYFVVDPDEQWTGPPFYFHPPMYDSYWHSPEQPLHLAGDDRRQNSFYIEPATTSINIPHHSNQELHTQQMVSNVPHHGPTHSDATLLKDASPIPPSGNRLHASDNVRIKQDPSFFNSTRETYQHLEHPNSSPILSNNLAQQESLFSHSTAANRRRSTADIRQQQRMAWPAETPSIQESQSRRKAPASEMNRSPPHDNTFSPASEIGPQSRRNSSTPMQISQQNPPLNIQHLPDFSMDASIHNPAIRSEGYPGSRRHSLAHGTDAVMGEVSISVASRNAGMIEPPSDHQMRGRRWQGQPPNQPHYDTTGTMDYDLAEINNNSMTYNTQFHHPLQHHQPHHDFEPPARPVVTTGAFTGNTRWWGGH